METKSPVADPLPESDKCPFLKIILVPTLPLIAVATMFFSGRACLPPIFVKFNILAYLEWIFLTWTPFFFAFWGFLVCRSIWRGNEKKQKWITGTLLAVPFAINAMVIAIYIFSQFWEVYITWQGR